MVKQRDNLLQRNLFDYLTILTAAQNDMYFSQAFRLYRTTTVCAKIPGIIQWQTIGSRDICVR